MTKQATCRRCGRAVGPDDLYCQSCGTLQVRPAAWSWRGSRPPVPPGWFADPFRRHVLRYWDGETWTDLVAGDDPSKGVCQDPLLIEQPSEELGHRGSLGVVVTGLLCAFGLSGIVVLALALAGLPGGRLVALVASEVGLWVAFLATCRLVSRRYGTGSFRRDFRIRIRWFDPLIGLVGGAVGWLIAGLVSLPFTSAHSSADPDRVLGIPANGATNWTVIVLLVCVGAPVVEEMFFRGLLQGELAHRYGDRVAVPLTALIFGACHVFNAPGVDGLIYAACVVGTGFILGLVFAWTRRLGASMATHAFFNGITLAAFAFALSRP